VTIPLLTHGMSVDTGDLNPIITLVNGIGALVTSSTTGTTNDAADVNGQLTNGLMTRLKLTNATLRTITGLSGGIDGALVLMHAKGGDQADLKDQDSGSAASNRIVTGSGGTISLVPNRGVAILLYDTNIWRVIYHDQGDWIDIAFNGANFTTNSTGSITPAAGGHPYVYRYRLRGKTMTLQCAAKVAINNGSTNEIRFALPAGVTPRAYDPLSGSDENQASQAAIFNDGTNAGAAAAFINNAGKYISVQRWDGTAAGNYLNGSNTFVRFTIDIPLA